MKTIEITDTQFETLADLGIISKSQEKKEIIEEPKTIYLQTGAYTLTIAGDYVENNGATSENLVDAGCMRTYKDQARKASDGLLRRNRLSALVELISCNTVGALSQGELNYKGDTKNNYHIGYSDELCEWMVYETYNFYPEVVYMNKPTAKRVCEILNNQEYTGI